MIKAIAFHLPQAIAPLRIPTRDARTLLKKEKRLAGDRVKQMVILKAQLNCSCEIGDIVSSNGIQYRVTDVLDENVYLEEITSDERVKPEYLAARF